MRKLRACVSPFAIYILGARSESLLFLSSSEDDTWVSATFSSRSWFLERRLRKPKKPRVFAFKLTRSNLCIFCFKNKRLESFWYWSLGSIHVFLFDSCHFNSFLCAVMEFSFFACAAMLVLVRGILVVCSIEGRLLFPTKIPGWSCQ